MRFKTLKHKTLPDTFGYFFQSQLKGCSEIMHCTIPKLLEQAANINKMKRFFKQAGEYGCLEQIKDYELVEVEIIECNENKQKDQG